MPGRCRDDARALTEARDRVLAGEPPRAPVRDTVLASWLRCREGGLRPEGCEPPHHPDLDPDGGLARAAAPVLDRLADLVAGVPVSIVLADEGARILERRAGGPGLDRHLDEVRLVPGAGFDEGAAGTNGIGTALATGRPALVRAGEHYADRLRSFVCTGAPVRDPLTGRIAGVVDLTRHEPDTAETADSMAELVRRASAAVEQEMLERCTDRERSLLHAWTLAAGRPGGTSAFIGPDDLDDPGELPLPEDWTAARRDRHARQILLETSAGLIARGERAAVEVRLPGAGPTVLISHPVEYRDGTRGTVVEARPAADHRHRVLRAVPAAPAPGRAPVRPGGARPVREKGPVERGTSERDSVDTDPYGGTSRPVMVGERGVGRFAVAARQRLALLWEAGGRIGAALDPALNAAELADLVVPRFADGVTVDLRESLLRGGAPPGAADRADTALRRAAARRRSGRDASRPAPGEGKPVEHGPATPQARSIEQRGPVLAPGPRTPGAPGAHRTPGTLLCVPLLSRNAVLGVVTFHRDAGREPFEEDDLRLAEALAARTALCADNAHRRLHERDAALALQRSLLPRTLPQQGALEIAHRYAAAPEGTGRGWYDVIPLSGARVALVVGDVVGGGLHAAATVARLRTAVQNFAALDLPADELLGRLDDLVVRLDAEAGHGRTPPRDRRETGAAGETGVLGTAGVVGEAGETGAARVAGATCLYAVHDAVARRCTMARAGGLRPALVHPDGTVEFPSLPPGEPLGHGGREPFESVELEVPDGARLVLFTDGLCGGRSAGDRAGDRGADRGAERLREVLAVAGRSPEETCDAVVRALLPAVPQEDAVLLVAAPRPLDGRRVARWDVPADPARVAAARAAVTRRLTEWGLGEVVFATELIVSELLTNAIRYGGGPIQLRLIRDRALTCEVFDGSSTSPRLRRAKSTDEGGRGLFLVAQLADRWGTRHTADGKVIWTEQSLDGDTPGL
ncbi:SpoIIE family protein phosphatase [Streptomyces sp. HB2AG]|nr:SpoIIE family protein phosphatase [Streptomyces sp. HB2AG]MCZ2527223.1 SpoIIE family protein phosphatase [Streptomyces sp. HB2AG]